MPVFTVRAEAFRVLALPQNDFLVFSGYLNVFTGFDRVNDDPRGNLLRYKANGNLDTGFELDPQLHGLSISAAASLPNNRLAVATFSPYTGTSVYRLNANGSIDASFAADPMPGGVIRALVAQPDGKILVGGTADDTDVTSGLGAHGGLLRLNTDGSMDTSFITVLSNPAQGTAGHFSFGTGIAEDTGIQIQPDGKIVIAGAFGQVNNKTFPAVARLNTDGSLDPGFAPSGFNIVENPSAPSSGSYPIRSVAVQSDGKIVLGGEFNHTSTGSGQPLIRLNANGSLDTSFNAPRGSSADAVRVTADGKILISGGTLSEYDSDGSLDAKFAGNVPGFQDSYGGIEYDSPPFGVGVLANGKILVVAGFNLVGTSARPGVARLNADGTLDASFNPGNLQTDASPSHLAVRADGTILASGPFDTVAGVARSGLALLYADGSLSATTLATFLSDPYDGSPDFLLQPDGKIFLFGSTPAPDQDSNPGFTYLRLNADLSVDPTFKADTAVTYIQDALQLPGGGYIADQGFEPVLTYIQNLNNLGSAAPSPFNLTKLDDQGSLDNSFSVDVNVNLISPPLTSNAPGQLTGNLANYVVTLGDARALAVQPDDRILFKYFDGTTYQLVRLNADGSFDDAFQAGDAPPQSVVTGFTSPINLGAGYSEQATQHSASDEAINGVLVQPDGSLLVYGVFTHYNGNATGGLVRLHADGTVDSTFNVGSGPAYAAEAANTSPAAITDVQPQPGGQLLLVGTFQVFNGVSLPGVARLNADGSLDTTFLPPVTANAQTSIGTYGQGATTNDLVREPDGSLLLVGNYTASGSNAAGTVLRLVDPSALPGAVLSGFDPGTGADGEVLAIAFQADGRALLGGSFATYRGVARAGIVRVNIDGTVDASFNPGSGTDYSVNAILIQPDGRIVIGGDFTTVNGTARNGLARLNADGSLDLGFNAQLSGGTPTALTARPGVEKSAHVQPLAASPNGKGFVTSLTAGPNGSIVVGGSFQKVANLLTQALARLIPTGAPDTSFNPGSGPNGKVNVTVTQPDGKTIIAGEFTSVGGTTRNGVARLNGDGSVDTTFDPGAGAQGGAVRALALQPDGSVILGGDFTSVGGKTLQRAARVKSDGSVDETFNPGDGANNTVNAVALQEDGKILLGGSFTQLADLLLNALGRLNPDGSVDTTFNPGNGTNGTVDAITVRPDGNILLGGDFTTVGNTALNRVALLKTGLVSASASAPTISVSVDATTISRAAGQRATVTFTRVGGDSGKLKISYTLGGSGVNGMDYTALSGKVKIKAGKKSASIQITPLSVGQAKKVKLALKGGVGYKAGSSAKVKIKIKD